MHIRHLFPGLGTSTMLAMSYLQHLLYFFFNDLVLLFSEGSSFLFDRLRGFDIY